MGVTLTIAGTNRDNWLAKGGSWNLSKRLIAESFNFTIENTIYDVSAYVPQTNETVRLLHGADLLFGGPVKKLKRYRKTHGGPLFVDVECRGWESLPESIVITGTIASGPVITRVHSLFTTYLQPKGVTWLGATTGGTTIPDVTFRNTKLSDLLTRMGKLGGKLWRINGDKQMGLNGAGDLAFPVSPLTGDAGPAGLLFGVTVDEDAYETATRLIIQSGGTGDADHSETHLGNGLKTIFALNVEVKPGEIGPPAVYYHPTTVVVNGVSNTIGGGVWSYDDIEHTVFKTGGAVPNGHTVVVAYKISFPATVRVWTPGSLTSIGAWNRAVMTDKALNLGHMTDVAEIKAWGDIELSRRQVLPRTMKGATRTKGFYPLQYGPCTFPAYNFSNVNFLLRGVNINETGIDPTDANHLVYDLDLIEGGEAGRMWEDIFFEFSSGGLSGGSTTVGGTGGPVSPGTITVGVLPSGTTIHLGGDNYNPVPATTGFTDIPQAIPNKFGGSGFGTGWTLNIAAFQLSAGTLEIQLLDQVTLTVLATASTTTVAAALSGGFGYASVSLSSIPATVNGILAKYRVTAGSRDVVIGHCTLTKD